MRTRPTGLCPFVTISLAASLLASAGQARSQDDVPESQAVEAPAQPQPQAETDAAEEPIGDPLDEPVTITDFAEPIDINDFVDMVTSVLDINVTKDSTLGGTIAFNKGVTITRRQLLPLLDARLEELGFTILPDTTGFYTIRRAGDITVIPGETTQFIPTPGLLPSALASTIQTHLSLDAGAERVTYDDELGSIIITAAPRRIAQIEALVDALIEQRRGLIIETIPLRFISAPVALERANELLGSRPATPVLPAVIRDANNPGGQPQPSQRSNGLTNLSQRLTTDPAGNALIFRGLPEELEEIRAVVERVDRANELVSKKYFTGSATRRIADLAERQGFGEVIEADSGLDLSGAGISAAQQQINRQFAQSSGAGASSGGSQLLTDEFDGYITYFATDEQQTMFEELIGGFELQDEIVVTQTYKLEYSDAEDVASILQSLIDRSQPQDEANPFLPQGQQAANANVTAEGFLNQPGALGEDETTISADQSFVIANDANNQVIVLAPRSQQSQFERLIRQIDLRRAQVYIEATIIAVNDTDDFRLAIEGAFQDLDASGNGGGIQSNFGLSAPGTGGFTDPRLIATSLSGVTAAVIRSDFVPIIINATKTETDSRVVATPQLLVDDNATAAVTTRQTFPFQVTTTTDFAQNVTFEEAEANTSLEVTPQISVGGTVRLDYAIIQQTFNSLPTDGSPPPRTENDINGLVSVPNGGTVVIGGLSIRNDTDTITKIPLLGDIPGVGHLFRDTNIDTNNSALFVFLTPKVLRNPNLQDYRLLTLGPAAQVELPDYIPELEPIMIESTFRRNDQPETPRGFVLPSDRDPTLNQQRLTPDEN